MNETDPTIAHPGPAPAPHDTDEAGALTPRRGPDLLTLLAGLGALGIAGTALLGGSAWLPEVDGRWVLATLALIVGLLLVIGSLRPRATDRSTSQGATSQGPPPPGWPSQ